MEIIKEIGAFAGFAAVIGLGVLSALYFSQARDVKRLREWAGRAPERAVEQITAQRVVAQPRPAVQPVPRPGTAGAAPAAAQAKPAATTPAGQRKEGMPMPAPAASANAGGAQQAAPPAAKPQPVPAAAGATASSAAPAKPGGPDTVEEPARDREPDVAPTGQPGPDAQPAGAPVTGTPPKAPAPEAAPKPAPEPPSVATPVPGGAPAGEVAREGTPGAEAAAKEEPSGWQRAFSGRGRMLPRIPRPAAGAPALGETAILPPYAEMRRRPLYQRLLASPRYLVLAIAGVLIVGGGAAFGIVQLSQEEAPPPKHQAAAGGGGAGQQGGGGTRPAPVNPANVTVSVLNGTTVPGLAAQIGDKIEGFGFQLGNVTNSSDQQRAESVVLYARGAAREAAAVSRRLGVPQREPIDPQSQALGGDASVVVIAGADQTQ